MAAFGIVTQDAGACLVSVNCFFRRRQLELPVFGARLTDG